MVGRELHGHGPAEVVADDVGAGQTEVGAESIEKPAPVSYPVPGEGLVRLSEPAQIQCIDGKALRQTTRELFPDAGRGQPAVYEHDRGSPTDYVVADQDPLELQVLRVTGALYLPGVTSEHEGGGEDHSDHNEQDYQCDAHGSHDNAKTRQQDSGGTPSTRPASAPSAWSLHRVHEP